MIKREELTNPASCMSRARDDEMTFVLLGRDKAAPFAIRAWMDERIRLGKNNLQDPQIQEAIACAFKMEMSAPEIPASPVTEPTPIGPLPLGNLVDALIDATESLVKAEYLSGSDLKPYKTTFETARAFLLNSITELAKRKFEGENGKA